MEVVEEPEAVVIRLAGDVDMTNVGQLRATVSQVAAGTLLVVDVNEVGYLDSAGVAVLFERARRGRLEVVAAPGCPVRRVLEVVAIGQLATLSDSRPAD